MSIPLRYQSDDGFCVIELRSKISSMAVRGDVTTFLEISDAVERIIDQCVVRVPAGGSATGFSTFAKLPTALVTVKIVLAVVESDRLSEIIVY